MLGRRSAIARRSRGGYVTIGGGGLDTRLPSSRFCEKSELASVANMSWMVTRNHYHSISLLPQSLFLGSSRALHESPPQTKQPPIFFLKIATDHNEQQCLQIKKKMALGSNFIPISSFFFPVRFYSPPPTSAPHPSMIYFGKA